jgi:hypothetical protein
MSRVACRTGNLEMFDYLITFIPKPNEKALLLDLGLDEAVHYNQVSARDEKSTDGTLRCASGVEGRRCPHLPHPYLALTAWGLTGLHGTITCMAPARVSA